MKRVQRLQKNAQQRKRRCKDTALLKKYYKKNAQPVTDKEEKRVRQLDNAQIKKHWMRQNCNTRAAEEDKYYSWQKTFLHKRRQDFIASILEGEGVVPMPMMQSEMLHILSVCLSWKMNMIAISLYLYHLYLKRRWKTCTCGS